MHLLYLDDSGSVGNASDKHIILAGLAVFERQPHWLSGKLDEVAREVWPDKPEALEFRGADIFSGKKHWRGVGKETRTSVYKRALRILADDKHLRLFGAVIHKAATSPDDPMEYAFEQVCMRFDKYLGRLHKNGDSQRGLIVLDDSTYETSLQSLSKEFRTIGHRWGQLYNLCDVPLFVNSTATRMIQFADIIAYALRRYHEKGEAEYFDIIRNKFDAEGGVLHGLTHHIPQELSCTCFSCRQRKASYAIPHATPLA
ncbi:DUF3800 domain-containing protein [Rhizobium sp.]